MDLAAYRNSTKPLEVVLDGWTLNITYRPNALSLGEARRLGDPTVEERAEDLLKFLATWDLEDEGHPVPLTLETLMAIPLNILLGIDEAIGDDLVPSEEEKRGSSEPSASQPRASTSPSTSSPPSDPTSSNGSQTSESLTASESVPSS